MADSTIFDAIADGMLRMASATTKAAAEIVRAAQSVAETGADPATGAPVHGDTTSTVELQPGKGTTTDLALTLSATVGRK